MKEICGCCEGLEKLTPLETANRPGLDAISYRVGTHAAFLETMMARLTTLRLDVAGEIYPLHDLTTRSLEDPSIALLDAWATVADVLAFYQERIANEGYLRTSTERRSILELARLVGYSLRPGVSASVFLAFDLEKGYDLLIEPGMRAQSLPGPGELPQSFETGEQLEARAAWNRLGVRMTRPQYIDSDNIDQNTFGYRAISKIYLAGTATNLKANDPLLFRFEGDKLDPKFRKVESIEAQSVEDRSITTLQMHSTTAIGAKAEESIGGLTTDGDTSEDALPDPALLLINDLLKSPSLPPASPRELVRKVSDAFAKESDIETQLLINLAPVLRSRYYSAWSKVRVPPKKDSVPVKSVEALRVKARPFGHNAPLKPIYNDKNVPVGYEEWPLAGMTTVGIKLTWGDRISAADPAKAVSTTSPHIRLSREYKKEIFSAEINANMPLSNPILLGEIKAAIKTKENSYKFAFQDKGLRSIKVLIEGKEAKITFGGRQQEIILGLGQKQLISKDERRVRASYESTESGLVISVSDGLLLESKGIERKTLSLDAQYDKILPGSWVVIERSGQTKVRKVESLETISRADYGITGTVTQLVLNDDWLESEDRDLSAVRKITVYAQGEALQLAEEAIDPEKIVDGRRVNDICPQPIELDGLYDGLKSGRWLIVSGERTDVAGATGVKASELVMLSNVTQKVGLIDKERLPLTKTGETTEEEPLPGDQVHTFLTLAKPLEYSYKRDTVTIYANVAKASHGETRNEVLGSGDGGKVFQEFQLRQSPLTYLAAATPAGAESTLRVRANDILWHEADSLADLEPVDRKYITSSDDWNKTMVVFGNGLRGSRLPSGVENVRAVYRMGIGKPGNVKAEQISQLAARPLGVKGVINPLPATGGADRESRDQARHNAPLAVLALGRLVSVQDYADFARTFAGIGKSRATKLSDGRRQMVFLTIAGAEDIPIDAHSDLYKNLVSALHKHGDPHQQIRVEMRELLLLVVSANVRVLPDYLWDKVEPKIRAAMLEAFSFERRELGQDVLLSEVISVIQAVEGVDYVDVDFMAGIPEKEQKDGERQNLTPEKIAPQINELLNSEFKVLPNRIVVKLTDEQRVSQPDQIAYLTPDVPDTLILREVKP